MSVATYSVQVNESVVRIKYGALWEEIQQALARQVNSTLAWQLYEGRITSFDVVVRSKETNELQIIHLTRKEVNIRKTWIP